MVTPPNGNRIAVAVCRSTSRSSRYWRFAETYYQKNGHPTGEAYNIRTALRPLRRLYGSTSASDFGPDSLEVVQRSMIDSGLSRNVINGRISRIKRMFRWASKKKLVPRETYYGSESH